MSGVGGRESETVRNRTTAIKGREPEVGSLEAGSFEAGSYEVGSRRSGVGGQESEGRSQRPGIGGQESEVGSLRSRSKLRVGKPNETYPYDENKHLHMTAILHPEVFFAFNFVKITTILKLISSPPEINMK
jgi:hypothetical protein